MNMMIWLGKEVPTNIDTKKKVAPRATAPKGD